MSNTTQTYTAILRSRFDDVRQKLCEILPNLTEFTLLSQDKHSVVSDIISPKEDIILQVSGEKVIDADSFHAALLFEMKVNRLNIQRDAKDDIKIDDNTTLPVYYIYRPS